VSPNACVNLAKTGVTEISGRTARKSPPNVRLLSINKRAQ